MAGPMGTLEEGGWSRKGEARGEQQPHIQVGTEASLGRTAATSPSSSQAVGLASYSAAPSCVQGSR